MTPKIAPIALDLPPDSGFSLISNRKLVDLYIAMLRLRRLARLAPSTAGETKGWHAAAVAVATDLLPHDRVAPALWAESPLNSIRPKLAVTATLSRALAAARSRKKSAKNGIVVFFRFGSSVPEAEWQSALQLAGSESLPMLFVSVTTNLAKPSRSTAKTLTDKAHSFPAILVDGNDLVALYRVATESITLARKGSGPTLIDCRSVPTDNAIRTMETYLSTRGILTPRLKRQIGALLRNPF